MPTLETRSPVIWHRRSLWVPEVVSNDIYAHLSGVGEIPAVHQGYVPPSKGGVEVSFFGVRRVRSMAWQKQ